MPRSTPRLAPLLLLAACATPYAPQATGPKAMVRFTSNVGDTFSFSTADTKACPKPSEQHIGGISGLSPGEVSTLKMYGTSPEREGRILEREIDADRPFPVLAFSTRGATQYMAGYTCSVGRSFVPKAGHQYEVNYQYNGTQCRVDIVELVGKEAGQFERVPEASASKQVVGSLREFCNRQ